MEFWQEVNSVKPYTSAIYKGYRVYLLEYEGLWHLCIDSDGTSPLTLECVDEIFEEFAPEGIDFQFVADRSVYQRVLLRQEKK